MGQIHGKQIKDASISQEKLNLITPHSGDTQSGATVGYVNNITDGKVSKSGDTIAYIIVDKTLITYQENLNVVSGSTNIIATLPDTYSAAFFDYLITNGTSSRVGTVMVVNSTTIHHTEVSTKDINDTSTVTLNVDLLGGYIRLLSDVNDSNTWTIKVHIRTF